MTNSSLCERLYRLREKIAAGVDLKNILMEVDLLISFAKQSKMALQEDSTNNFRSKAKAQTQKLRALEKEV